MWNFAIQRKVSVEVENGAEPTIALGSQEIVGVKPPLFSRYLDTFFAPLGQEE